MKDLIWDGGQHLVCCFSWWSQGYILKSNKSQNVKYRFFLYFFYSLKDVLHPDFFRGCLTTQRSLHAVGEEFFHPINSSL